MACWIVTTDTAGNKGRIDCQSRSAADLRFASEKARARAWSFRHLALYDEGERVTEWRDPKHQAWADARGIKYDD